MEPVKVGVIGITGFGGRIVRAVAEAPELELVTGFSRTAASRKKLAEEHGCKEVSSAEELLGMDEIEAVLIGTPNHIHAEYVIKAARAGKNVFVDKPITNEIGSAKECIAACKEAGVVLQVGHNSRRGGRARRLKELIEAGELGQVIACEANNSHSGGLKLKSDRWRWYNDKCPSGPLMQLGIHCIDTLHYLLGPVKEVSSFIRKLATPGEIDDSTATILIFQSGVVGFVGAYYACPSVKRTAVFGTGANAYLERNGHILLVRSDKTEEEIEPEEVNTILDEVQEFGRCIREGKRPEVGGEEALLALAVVRAAIKSSQENRTVTIEEMLQ